jgi:hypothetical protein
MWRPDLADADSASGPRASTPEGGSQSSRCGQEAAASTGEGAGVVG